MASSGYNQYTAMAVFATMTLSSAFTTASAQYDSEPQAGGGASCLLGMSIIMIISSLILSGFAILRW